MLKVRLMRQGAKRRPFYTIGLTQSTSPAVTWPLKKIGFYNPIAKKGSNDWFRCDFDMVKDSINQGAQITDRIFFLLNKAGFFNGDKSKQVQKIFDKHTKKLEMAKKALAKKKEVAKETSEQKK